MGLCPPQCSAPALSDKGAPHHPAIHAPVYSPIMPAPSGVATTSCSSTRRLGCAVVVLVGLSVASLLLPVSLAWSSISGQLMSARAILAYLHWVEGASRAHPRPSPPGAARRPGSSDHAHR